MEAEQARLLEVVVRGGEGRMVAVLKTNGVVLGGGR